ncbi:hypothetical protein E4U61_007917 [Claviceps capensis]|nr:hypothetical protein E4U61_007917 [Claviceps capensis]
MYPVSLPCVGFTAKEEAWKERRKKDNISRPNRTRCNLQEGENAHPDVVYFCAPWRARTPRGRYRQCTRDDCVCNDDYATAYHKILSILETGSVLKTTDFEVHWFPAVVHEAWKPVARRPNAKASSTARGNTRNELTDRNDVEPSDQGPIPGSSQAVVRLLARDRLTGVLHQLQVDLVERAEKAARELRHAQEQQSLRFWQQHPQPPPTTQHAESHEDKAEDRSTTPWMAVRVERAALTLPT